MGYDATYTEAVGDLLQHSVTPEEYDLTKVSENAFLPDSLRKRIPWIKDVQDRLKRQSGLSKKGLENPCSIGGAWRAFDMCQPELAKRKTDRGDVPLAGRHYYMCIPNYEKTEEMPKGRDEFFVPVKVGSADLDKVSLRCALLVMASCSAVDHYYGPLKRRRQEAKSSCKFMLMVDSSTPSHARNFLDLIFQGLDPLTRKGAVEVLKKLHHFGISVLL
jgi:hypothetical protein